MILSVTNELSSSRVTNPGRTSNGEHIQPGPLLDDTNEKDNSDDSEGDYGKPFRQLVHAVLEWSPLLLNILHHTKDDTKFGLGSGGNNDARATACAWLIVKYLPTEA